MPMAMKNMNWLFDTAKRDAHARLTGVLGGISAKKRNINKPESIVIECYVDKQALLRATENFLKSKSFVEFSRLETSGDLFKL